MHIRTLILATALLIFAAAPAMASQKWTDNMPQKLGECYSTPPAYIDGLDAPFLLSYFHPETRVIYTIKYKDKTHFDLTEAITAGVSTPLQLGIPLEQAKRIIKSKCSKQ